jgi:hypothetical protein
MPTETQPQPAPGVITPADLNASKSGNRTPLPNSVLDAINKEAGIAPAAIALPDPPSDTPPPYKTPPTQPQREVAPTKPADKPAAEPAGKKKEGIEAVREALERSNQRVKELQESGTASSKQLADAYAKTADLESKVTKYEQEIEKDYKPRVARLTELEKKLQAREETLKIKAYQETDEFHEKYVKPLASAQREVGELLGELEVNEGDQPRKATAADFEEILGARSINDAARIAREKFGPDVAQQVVSYRTKIRSLERERQEAVKNAALHAEEFEQRQRSQQAQANQAVRDRLLAETQRIISGDPEVAIPEDDNELKEALASGSALADRLLNGDPNMSHEQFVSEIAKGRSAIISRPVLAKKVARLTAENESLKKQLKEYQNSEPDVVARGGGLAPVKSNDPAKDRLLAAANAAAVAR